MPGAGTREFMGDMMGATPAQGGGMAPLFAATTVQFAALLLIAACYFPVCCCFAKC